MLMEEEADEEEAEEELAPMAVQLAFIASQLGRHGEALEAYQVRCLGCVLGVPKTYV
jgi:hypothetical protein